MYGGIMQSQKILCRGGVTLGNKFLPPSGIYRLDGMKVAFTQGSQPTAMQFGFPCPWVPRRVTGIGTTIFLFNMIRPIVQSPFWRLMRTESLAMYWFNSEG
jgi:hypothetical protein